MRNEYEKTFAEAEFSGDCQGKRSISITSSLVLYPSLKI